MNANPETPECHPLPKWAVLINNRLFPMPRRRLAPRDIRDQSGIGNELVFVRDYSSTSDPVLDDHEEIDLGEGNVFRTIPRCEAPPHSHCEGTAKFAFVLDDAWEETLIARQTGYSLKRLFGVPDDAELLRDFESPNDKLVQDEEVVIFPDGPVFTLRHATFTVKVNTKPVRFVKRRVTGMEIKETAIKQDVKIEIGFVLYRLKPDGGLGPAIRDDEEVLLKDCDEFSCVAPDDKS